MIITTWNVNSIRARLSHVKDYLAEYSPDVLCIQESKVADDLFPVEPLEDEGYNVEIHGQKAYNGVAILSKHPMEDVFRGIPGIDPDDRRAIGCIVEDTMILNLYCPNGSEVGSDKFAYKMDWFDKLHALVQDKYPKDEKVVICGDFNITFDDRDVHDAEANREKIHCSTPERDALARILDLGYTDSFRRVPAAGELYTWWHYMRGGFPKNEGMRIDHMLLSEPAMEACSAVEIHRDERGKKSASDHAPVAATLG